MPNKAEYIEMIFLFSLYLLLIKLDESLICNFPRRNSENTLLISMGVEI